jgi:hypothetical protein
MGRARIPKRRRAPAEPTFQLSPPLLFVAPVCPDPKTDLRGRCRAKIWAAGRAGRPLLRPSGPRVLNDPVRRGSIRHEQRQRPGRDIPETVPSVIQAAGRPDRSPALAVAGVDTGHYQHRRRGPPAIPARRARQQTARLHRCVLLLLRRERTVRYNEGIIWIAVQPAEKNAHIALIGEECKAAAGHRIHHFQERRPRTDGRSRHRAPAVPRSRLAGRQVPKPICPSQDRAPGTRRAARGPCWRWATRCGKCRFGREGRSFRFISAKRRAGAEIAGRGRPRMQRSSSTFRGGGAFSRMTSPAPIKRSP